MVDLDLPKHGLAVSSSGGATLVQLTKSYSAQAIVYALHSLVNKKLDEQKATCWMQAAAKGAGPSGCFPVSAHDIISLVHKIHPEPSFTEVTRRHQTLASPKDWHTALICMVLNGTDGEKLGTVYRFLLHGVYPWWQTWVQTLPPVQQQQSVKNPTLRYFMVLCTEVHNRAVHQEHAVSTGQRGLFQWVHSSYMQVVASPPTPEELEQCFQVYMDMYKAKACSAGVCR